jgi:hypothetical protein
MNIHYIQNNENIISDKILTLYDFGDIKGFLYENEFRMFKILKRNDFEEICEEFYGNIPLHVFSIETYNCIYENNIYKTNNLFIELKQPLQSLDQQPSQPSQHQKHQQQPSQQQPSQQDQSHQSHRQQQQSRQQVVKQQRPFVQPPLHQQQSKINNLIQHEGQINEKYKKTQQGVLYSQQPLVASNAGQQWISLEGLMKLPFVGVDQAKHLQPVVRDQTSVALSHSKHSLRVRLPQQQPLTQHQGTIC